MHKNIQTGVRGYMPLTPSNNKEVKFQWIKN